MYRVFLFLFLCLSTIEAQELKWQLHLNNFISHPGDTFKSGRICQQPLIKDGKFWIIRPEAGTKPTTTQRMPYTIVGIHSLVDGAEVTRYQTLIECSTYQWSYASQDTDLPHGVFWSFAPSNTILAATGGDFPGRWVFDPDTGDPKTITGFTGTVIGTGANCATAFAATGTSRYIISGGTMNHSYMSANGGIHDVLKTRTVPWVGYKQWNTGLVNDNWCLRLDDIARYKKGIYGLHLWGLSSINGGVGCEVLGWTPYNYLGSDSNGYPKPMLMLNDGRVVVLCGKSLGRYDGLQSLIDTNSESRLVIVSDKKTGTLGMVPGFTSWYNIENRLSDPIAYNPSAVASLANPRLVQSGNMVVVLFPAISGSWPTFAPTKNYLCGVNVDTGKVVWNKEAITTKIVEAYKRDNFPRHNQVTIVEHKGVVHLLEFAGMKLNGQKFEATTGNWLGSYSLPVNSGKVADIGFETVQSVQSTDQGILVSLLYRSNKLTNQSCCLLTP